MLTIPYDGEWVKLDGKSESSPLFTYIKPFVPRYNAISSDYISNGRFALRLC